MSFSKTSKMECEQLTKTSIDKFVNDMVINFENMKTFLQKTITDETKEFQEYLSTHIKNTKGMIGTFQDSPATECKVAIMFYLITRTALEDSINQMMADPKHLSLAKNLKIGHGNSVILVGGLIKMLDLRDIILRVKRDFSLEQLFKQCDNDINVAVIHID